MRPMRRGELSSPWVITAVSVVLLAGLILLLWRPWENQGIAGNRKLVFFCAAGMAKPIQAVMDEYKEKYGAEVQANFQGTGTLLSSIRASGGKGDLFLAGDRFHMDKAVEEGLVKEVIPVAHFHPVLAVKRSVQKRLKKEGKPVTSLRDLLRDDLKVVLANPDMAAIGRLTKKVLSKPEVGLWAEIEKRLKSAGAQVSTVGTVNKVTEQIRTGNDRIGIVWRAVARQQGLEIIEAPEFQGVSELIQIGVLASAKDEQATAALQFARYVTARDKGLKYFTKFHYDPMADADTWSERPEIHLFSGAMLKPGIEKTVKEFSEREGVSITTNYNGCGILVSQMRLIKGGNPSGGHKHFPDGYFSCDSSFMKMVEDWFEADVLVSKNKMVLIVQKGNPKNITFDNIAELGDLRLGLGHRKNSALGKLTKDLLEKTGLYQKLWKRQSEGKIEIVEKDAGHHLVNDVRVGALDIAIVYQSNAKANPENVQQHMDIKPINIKEAFASQPFAVAKGSKHKYLMKRLLQAIVSQQTANRFRSLGFEWKYEE